MASSPDSTVIVGGGIIGLSTAYYLARAQNCGNNISIIDIPNDLVSAASAKANGVLADYDYPPTVSDLGHLSCKLHKELAEAYDGKAKWGYAETVRHYLSLKKDGDGSRGLELKPQYKLPEWIRGREKYRDEIKGNPRNCARVDPRKFVTFLRKKCTSLGVTILLRSEVVGVQMGNEGVSAIRVRGPEETYDLQCRSLVISAGSWSERIVENLFPESLFKLNFDKTPLAGGNWLVLKAPRPSGDDYCHQVYVESITSAPVEISDYRDGRIYVGGYLGDAEPLPATPSDVNRKASGLPRRKTLPCNSSISASTGRRCWKWGGAVGRCWRLTGRLSQGYRWVCFAVKGMVQDRETERGVAFL
ncbi:FAD/NAD(P)-binding domain-containing protein [Karstenula rhodostoma CBS 690.94]|uniref:FAD/NAD(P)-binding domain-containing protein n=1 Tax=Karstenula rhodostoma CBS 690.94 TaxID=1392251 RepID=A0A9P4UDC8_9PLEO|nr:FAD/NAD(P)-binding domain-containing protein [Karstenula rhodostoma CBS 690.94]